MHKGEFNIKKLISIGLSLVFVLFTCALLPREALAADTKVDFSFSRNALTFKRDKTGKNVSQTPMITISGVTNPEQIKGYSATYIRTHQGNGARLAKNDAVTAQPALAGTYTVVMKFDADVPFVCKNGTKTQEYPAAFVIKRSEQAPPILRSAAASLTDNTDKTGGSIAEGKQAVISIAWSSGLKPILTWTAGSEAVVTAETGKPARFTAKTPGTAVLTALLPEDNNYLQSAISLYTVTVTGSAISSSFYSLNGQTKNQSGWYTSDITILGKNGFTKVVPDGEYPISTDGASTLKFALENESGGKTEGFTINVKKDSTPPSIDNIRINDSPWVDPPEDYEAAWSADSNLLITADIYDGASGIAMVEYRIDAGDYISDENAAFKNEGYNSHEFSYTLENTGHMLWIRVTDTAGNVLVADYILPSQSEQKNEADSKSEAASSSESDIYIDVDEITEPTEAMNAVSERLNYLIRCNIEARVTGDVRANADYITQTLDMFTALSAAERKALGDEALGSLRAYFEKLYEIQGKDKAELDPLFVFKVLQAPSSVSSTVSQSEIESESESVASGSDSLPPGSYSESLQSSPLIPPQAPADDKGRFSFFYLIPLAAAIAALCVYFAWRKSMVKAKTEFKLPLIPDNDSESFSGFNDMDE